MCYCNPSIRAICCGKIDCIPPSDDQALKAAMSRSGVRARQVLVEKGQQLTFDQLIAAIYFQGFKDAMSK